MLSDSIILGKIEFIFKKSLTKLLPSVIIMHVPLRIWNTKMNADVAELADALL